MKFGNLLFKYMIFKRRHEYVLLKLNLKLIFTINASYEV